MKKNKFPIFPSRDADGTLDGISSLTNDNTQSKANNSNEPANESDDNSDSGNISHELQSEDPFNDTIDRMEFMMKKGQELLACGKNKIPNHLASPTNHKTPPSVKTTLNILKPRNTNSPASTGKLFKKPDAMLITPGVFKKPPISGGSRIPRPKAASVPRKQKFNHIVSPVGMYINKMAPSPMQTTNKPEKRDFFDTTISCQAAKELNFSVVSDSSMTVSNFAAKMPKKAYISASKRYVSSERVSHRWRDIFIDDFLFLNLHS